MADLKETPSQTAGPYVHIGCLPATAGLEARAFGSELGGAMVTDGAVGEPITLEICVFDGDGAPVKDALIEIWQTGPDGGFQSPGFAHWGRAAAEFDTGITRFETLKPGATTGAPHILLWIAARGINLALTTRLYFEDEDNSRDPVFALAGDRAAALVAKRTQTGYRHDIHLQGPEETVFFDV